MENLVDYYYKTLHTTTKPGNHIAKFYWEIFSLEPNKGDIIMFNKFIKLYGREDVFYAIAFELPHIPNLDLNSRPYGLIKKIIVSNKKNKLTNGSGGSHTDLSKEIKRVNKEMEKRKDENLVFENPFEDGKDE